jgi:ATP dependent DNA ligase domain
MARIKSSEMPRYVKPQLAILKARAPQGDQWLHEIKFDGYRVQIHLNKAKRKVYTRNGLDWTKRFSAIAGALDYFAKARSRASRETERPNWNSYTRLILVASGGLHAHRRANCHLMRYRTGIFL